MPARDEDPYAAQTVEVEELEPEAFEADRRAVDEVELPPEFEPDERRSPAAEAALAAVRAADRSDRASCVYILVTIDREPRRRLALEEHLAGLDARVSPWPFPVAISSRPSRRICSAVASSPSTVIRRPRRKSRAPSPP